jgi:hypothetical protein
MMIKSSQYTTDTTTDTSKKDYNIIVYHNTPFNASQYIINAAYHTS